MRCLIPLLVVVVSCSVGYGQSAKEKSDAFFSGKDPVPTLKVEVDPVNLKMLKENPRNYVRGIIRNDTVVYRDVGLHLKGAAGSFRPWDDKPALTINSNKFKSGQTFNGLDKFHLNNTVQDGSAFNELISAEMFLAAGVPAPRAAHVIVELNGRKVGLYVLKEGFDEVFLARHFEQSHGNLYDGGFLRDIDQDLKLDHGRGSEWKDLKSLVRACRIPDHKERLKEMDKLLNLDQFFAFWALEVLTCDWDGYTRNRNNYRIYHDPKSDKMHFFVHGKDQLFGNPADPVLTNWGGLCARRLFETEEGRKRYVKTLKDIFEKYFDLKKILKRIDELTPRTVDALKAVNKDWANWYQGEVRGEKQRITARHEWLKNELPKLK